MKKRKDTGKITHDKKNLLVIVFIIVIALSSLAAYVPILGNSFLMWDDDMYVTKNEMVLKGLTSESLRWAFSNMYFSFYSPLTWISHMTDVQLYGLAPKGHFATNLILHALNSVLLFIFLKLATGSDIRSFLAAMLFAIHPMNVESVAWLAERKNLLSVLFMLLSLIFYTLRHSSSRPPARPTLYTSAAYLFFVMGLMSKSSIVVLPALFLLFDIWPLRRISAHDIIKNRRASAILLIEKIPFFALSILFGILTIIAQRKIDALPSLEALTLPQRLGGAITGFGFYLEKFFLPIRLCAFYPHHKGQYDISLVMPVLLLLSMITFIFFKLRKKAPALLVGWGVFIVSLLPVIGILQVGAQAYADRYAYFSYWGLFVIVLFGVGPEKFLHGGKVFKVVLVLAATVIISTFFLLTRAQTAHWKDDGAVWKNVIKISPNIPVGYCNLANYYKEKSGLEEALPYYKLALERYDLEIGLYPQAAVPYYDKACALINMERSEEALELLQMARDRGYNIMQIEDKTKVAKLEILFRRWQELKKQERWNEAEPVLQAMLAIDAARSDIWAALGYVRIRKNDLASAKSAFQKALELDGSRDEVIFNLALIDLKNKDITGAEEKFKMLVDRNSRFAEPLRQKIYTR